MEVWRLAWRVAVAVVVIATPTVLFLMLWRGLMRLRDDELVRRVEQRLDEPAAPALGEHSPSPQGGGSSPTAPDRPPDGGADTERCPRCGRENVAEYEFCRECLAPLDGE